MKTPDKLPTGAIVAALAGGAAGLINEMIWLRLVSIASGATAPALALVLATFFGGLSLGAACASRVRVEGARVARLYACAEAAAASFSIALPFAIRLLTDRAAPPVLCAAILAIPTFMMGASLPLLCAAARANARRASHLYIINTLGGALGVVAAGCALLEFAGIAGSAAVACAGHSLAALAGFGLRGTAAPEITDNNLSEHAPAKWVLSQAFLTGAVAITGETILNRLLYQVLGGTTYAITATLAIYLFGIVIGAAAANRFRTVSPQSLAFCYLILGAATIESLYILIGAGTRLRMEAPKELNLTFGAVGNLAVAASVLAPPALASGFVFPCLVRRIGGHSASALGSVYACNTIGGIAASLAVTFILIPAFGMHATLAGAGFIMIIAAAATARGNLRFFSILAICGFIILQMGAPVDPARFRLWLYGPLAGEPAPPASLESGPAPAPPRMSEISIIHVEGASATADVYERKSPSGKTALDFAINGKKEASTDFEALRNQYVLGHLPVMLCRDPRRALVVGLGAGVTAGAVAAHPGIDVTIAELSPEVPAATRKFNEWNHNVLDRKNVNLIIQDGRRFLVERARSVDAGTAEAFDVITSDPIHPWVSGAANLYTTDYFKLVGRALSRGGVAAHWLPLYEMHTDESCAIFRSFAAAFPICALWINPTGDAVLVGARESLQLNLTTFAARGRADGVRQDLKSVGLEDPLRFLGALCVFRPAIDGIPGPEIADWNQILEFRAARNLYHKQTVSENLRFFGSRAAMPREVARFLGVDGPAVPRLLQMAGTNISIVKARGLLDEDDAGAWRALLDARVREPNQDVITILFEAFLAAHPEYNKKLEQPASPAEALAAASVESRRARRQTNGEGIARLSRLAEMLQIEIGKNAAPEIDRALRMHCAAILGETREYARALELLTPSLAENPPDPAILRTAALLYEKLGRPDDARSARARAAPLDLRGAEKD
ncbi:MAG: hypothetical protein HY286_04905 [Planctomycetes bacterium]|nr:hypothetical protein [Planctomycetota bacterium]